MTHSASSEAPKQASSAVVAQQAAMLRALPFSDTADFDDAARGFMGTVENARITNAQGRVVWSLEPYGFLTDEKAPATVNPSLWRQSRLNMNHGLFEVVPGVYQVRGLDIANMTLIEGERGVIVVDTLTSIEGARAAMELYFAHRGRRPVSAVIFTTPIPTIGVVRGECSTTKRWRAVGCRSSRLIFSWSTRFQRTSSPVPRCCGERNISSDLSWRRVHAAKSIAGSANRWRRDRWRCCGRPTSS